MNLEQYFKGYGRIISKIIYAFFLTIFIVQIVFGQTIKPTSNENQAGRLSDDEWVWSVLEGDFPSTIHENVLPLLKVCLQLDDQQIAEIKKLADYDKQVNQAGKGEWYAETQPGRKNIGPNLQPGEPVKQGSLVRKLLGAKDEDFREWVKEEDYIRFNTRMKSTTDEVDKKFPFQSWDKVYEKKRFFKLDSAMREKIFRLRIEYESLGEEFKDSPAHHSVWVRLQQSEPYQKRQRRRQDILNRIKEVMSQY